MNIDENNKEYKKWLEKEGLIHFGSNSMVKNLYLWENKLKNKLKNKKLCFKNR